MRIKKIITGIFIFLVSITACRKPLLQEEVNDEVIVQAFLTENSSVGMVRITKAIKYDEVAEQLPVTDASVSINGPGRTLTMVPTGNLGYYSSTDTIYRPQVNQAFELACITNNKLYRATTVIPAKPSGFHTTQNTIELQKIAEGIEPSKQVVPILLSWANPDSSFYYLSIQNTEDEPEFINAISDQLDETKIKELTILNTAVTNGNHYMLDPFKDLTFFGTHRLVIFHINSEYQKLLAFRSGNGSLIAEAVSNIENGNGIFTGISTDTLFLEAIKINR